MIRRKFINLVGGDEKKFNYVEVLFDYVKFGEIDTMNEKYQAEVNIESRWIENDYSISLYDPKKHWNPQLFIENALQLTKEQISYDIERQNDGTVWIVEKRNVKGTFWERLELQNFPFDIQELSITLGSRLDKSQIRLVSNPQKFSFVRLNAVHTFIDQQKWRLIRLVKVREFSYEIEKEKEDADLSILNSDSKTTDLKDELISTRKNTSKIVKIQSTCYICRKAGYYIFNAFLLIFLITASSLTLFSVECKYPQNRIQTTQILLLTSVNFKWVTNRYLPSISYLTSLDTYAIFSIFYICILCVWHALVGVFWCDKSYGLTLDKCLLGFFGFILLVFNAIVIIRFYLAQNIVNKLKKKEKKFLEILSKSRNLNYIIEEENKSYYNIRL